MAVRPPEDETIELEKAELSPDPSGVAEMKARDQNSKKRMAKKPTRKKPASKAKAKAKVDHASSSSSSETTSSEAKDTFTTEKEIKDKEGESHEGSATLAGVGSLKATAQVYLPAPTSLFQSDTVSGAGDDLLDVESEAKAFANLIASESFKPPLAIGVFGAWGSGKSFFMKQISKALQEYIPEKPYKEDEDRHQGFKSEIVEIEFNAWHYMESNVWASLVDVIFKGLDQWITERNNLEDSHKEQGLFDRLSTAQDHRLQALSEFTAKVGEAARAQNILRMAKNELAENGPDLRQYWEAVQKRLIVQPDFQSGLDTLGLESVGEDLNKFQAAVGDIKKTAKEGNLAFSILHARLRQNPKLLLWVIPILGLPLGLGYLLQTYTQSDTLSSLTATSVAAFATLSGWVLKAGEFAKSGIAIVKSLTEEIENIEQDCLREEALRVSEAEIVVEQAKNRLGKAEEQAHEAYNAVQDARHTRRMASFIKERAEGDTYSRHLSLIATIRKDFEQLSALIAPDLAEEETSAEWADYKKKSLDQINLIESNWEKQEGIDEKIRVSFETIYKIKEKLNEARDSLTDEADIREIHRIVLYVDDLDRCPPKQVYKVLQALHLFLNFPLFVIVVGVDTRWMETALKEELGSLVDGSSGANPKDYLEKIFQIPYWTRSIEDTASSDFISDLVDARQLDKEEDKIQDENGDDRPQENPLNEEKKSQAIAVNISAKEKAFMEKIAPFAGNTPRRLLRFVNVYCLIKAALDRDFDFKSLMTQLAISTAAAEQAGYYFTSLERADTQDGDKFEALMFALQEQSQKKSVPDDQIEIIRGALAVLMEEVGVSRPEDKIKNSSKSSAKNSGKMTRKSNLGIPLPLFNGDTTSLFNNLRETAFYARRYTFASQDAQRVEQADQEDKA